MGTRNQHSFHFPIKKFDDRIGLFKNFRYLEDYLQNISKSGHQGPTIYVAATDASQQSKDFADYLCDGVADNSQIQSALDDLPTQGGRVLLSEGTFTTASQVNLPSGDTIIEGLGSKWKVVAGGNAIHANGGKDVIKGFQFTNISRAANTSDFINAGDSRLIVTENLFIAITCKVLIGSETISDFGTYIITQNFFEDIALHDSGGGVESLGIFVEGGAGSRAQQAIFSHNYLHNITFPAQGGGHSANLVYSESGNGQAVVFGNHANDVNSLTFGGGNAIDSHNVIDGVHIVGDHNLQLSDLTDVGVTTPTDKNVLVADGDSWESRALVHNNDVGSLGADDHHAQAHTVASHSDTTGTGAELETLTDGSETSLHSHATPPGSAFSEFLLIGA